MTSLEAAERDTAHTLLSVEAVSQRVLLAAATVSTADPTSAARLAREHLVTAIYQVRRSARAHGADRFYKELRAQNSAFPHVASSSSQDADYALAAQTAANYSDAVLRDAATNGRARILMSRVETIAATESASAFNDERARIEKAMARNQRTARLLPIAIKSWSAHLESRTTCRICRGMHGQTRPWGINFEGGREPGKVHPRCRCIARYLLAPVGYQRKAA